MVVREKNSQNFVYVQANIILLYNVVLDAKKAQQLCYER